MRTEDDYIELVNGLSERLSDAGPDEAMRLLIKQEVDRRLAPLLKLGVFLVSLWYASDHYGTTGTVIVCAAGFLWMMISVWADDFNPAHDRHLVVSQAEDLVRLQVVASAFADGEACWAIEERKYDRDKRKIIAAESSRWDNAWERIYEAALAFEGLSPRQRRKRLMRAAKDALQALEQMAELAKREKAEPVFWAENYLHKLQPR